MSSILTCPACQGQVPLPEGHVERLACPHCENELQLRAQVAPPPEEAPPQQFVIPPAPSESPSAASRQPPPTSTVADYRKRVAQQSQRPSMLGQMVGIVAGGALGMVMGYWLLNYFGGPRYDFLGIPLPLVPHTQTARPAPPNAPAPAALAPSHLMEEEEPPPPRKRLAAGHPAAPPAADQSAAAAAPAALEFPSYSPQELGAALAAAHAAAGCENCQSSGFVRKLVDKGASEAGGRKIDHKTEERVPCEVCGGKPTGRVNAEVYAHFCRLAEVITYVDGSARDGQLPHRRAAAEQVFLRAAGDREKQAALGRMAVHHLQNANRATNGVLLAGTVQETGRAGEFYTARLLMFGLPEEITVLSTAPARFKPQDRVLLAGSIIDQPRHRLPGYLGAAPRVVFGGLPVHLPAEQR
jgi:hypothetical protein